MNNTGSFKISKVGLIAMSHLAHDVYPAFLAVIMPLLIVNLNLTYSQSGLIFFLSQIPSILTPLFGIFMDRYNMRYLAALSPAISALTMSFLPGIASFEIICLLTFLSGLNSALYHIPTPVMIKEYAGNKIGRGMSLYMFGGEIARTIGPLMIMAAIAWWGAEGAYKIALPGIIVSVAILITLRKSNMHNNQNGSKEHSLKILLLAWRKLKNIFIISIGLVLSKAFLIKALTSYLPTYMTENKSDLWVAGASLSILQLAGAAGALTSGTLSDYFGRKRMIFIVTVTAPLFMLMFIYTESFLFIPLLIIMGFINFSINPLLLAMIQENESEYPASANSIYMTINFVINSVVVFLFGFLSDYISLKGVYLAAAIASFIGIPFVLMLPGSLFSRKIAS
jgi:FSR family fosmidomycin resistance protein-like MFS transporter